MKKQLIVILILIFIIFTIGIIFSPSSKTEISKNYHTYDEMSYELKSIEENYSTIAKQYELGKTIENRTIFAMKISDNPNIDEDEPSLLFMGGLHANELVSVEMPMHLLNYLVENYDNNVTIKNYVNNREIWIVPMANPDGHVYVEEVDENWRKNRKDNKDGTFGVDLNRNFEYMWGVDNVSSNETKSNFYHGTYPFSENETCAIRDLALAQNFTASISFHSWGEYVFYPWGYTTDEITKDNELLKEIARIMASFSNYKNMQASQFYPAKGDSEDWLYSKGVLAFTIELGKEYAPLNFTNILEDNLKSCLYLIKIADNPENVFSYDFEIICEKNIQIITKNSVVFFNLTLINKGNTNNQIYIHIQGIPESWSVEIEKIVNLSVDETKYLTLKVNVGEFGENKEVTLIVKIDSKDDNQTLNLIIKESLENGSNENANNDNENNIKYKMEFIFILIFLVSIASVFIFIKMKK